jgi:hypothetical protein
MGGKGNGLSGRTVTVVRDADGKDWISEDRHYQASKTRDNYVDPTVEDDYILELPGDEELEPEEDEGGDADSEGDGDDEEAEDADVTEVVLRKAEDIKYIYLNRAAVSPAATAYHAGTAFTDWFVRPDSTETKAFLKEYGAEKMAEWGNLSPMPFRQAPTQKSPWWKIPITLKEWWKQFYLDQYTTVPLTAGDDLGALYRRSFPHLYSEIVRPQAMFILTRPWKAGSDRRYVLVREYVKRYAVNQTNINKGFVETDARDSKGKMLPKGNVLRRDIEKVAPTRYTKDYHWEGNYTWILCKFNIRKLGRVCFHIKEGTFVGWHAAPRIFHWQEILGSSVEKRTDKEYPGEPAVDGNRRMIVREAGGRRIPVGFDERWQYNDGKTYTSNVETNLKHKPLEDMPVPAVRAADWERARSDGLTPGNTPDIPAGLALPANSPSWTENATGRPLVPNGFENDMGAAFGAFDNDPGKYHPNRNIIWVRERDPADINEKTGKAKGSNYFKNAKFVPYRKLTDFVFPYAFWDGNGWRGHDVVCLTVAVEARDEVEVNTDLVTSHIEHKQRKYRYNGMIFNVYVAPNLEKELRLTRDNAIVRQWWERDGDEGLTGLQAVPAISTNASFGTEHDRAITAANYAKLNHSPKGEDLKSRLDAIRPEDYDTDDAYHKARNDVYLKLAAMYSSVSSDVDYFDELVKTYGEDDENLVGRELLPHFSPGFHRVAFGDVDPNRLATECLERAASDPAILEKYALEKLTDLPPGESPRVVFYYSDADLLDIVNADENAEYFEEMKDGGRDRLELAAELIRDNNPDRFQLANGVTAELWLRPIAERWDLEDVGVGTLQAPPKVVEDPESGQLQAFDDEQTAYRVISNPLHARTIAGEIIGSATQTVPVVKTEGYDNRRIGYAWTGTRGQFTYAGSEVMEKSLGFLAGEMVQDQARPSDPGEEWKLNPAVDEETGRPAAIPHRQIHGKVQADGTPVVVRDFTAPTTRAAVAMCYQEYEGEYRDGQGNIIPVETARERIRKLYGMKDQRSSIGFHRFGPESDRELGRDHYEIVSLGVAGYNPYVCDFEDSWIAMMRDVEFAESEWVRESGDELVRYEKPNVYKTRFNYDPRFLFLWNNAPDFVFDRPIDGAGTMVVNGNLVIRSRFAYYGTLVVLGDVVVDPGLRTDELVYGASGNPVDASGNPLISSDGYWYYRWINVRDPQDTRLSRYYLDFEGRPILDEDGNPKSVEPLREHVQAGEFILQGNLVLRGRLRNLTVDDLRGPAPANQPQAPVGLTTSYASPIATDAANGASTAAYASLSAAFPGGNDGGEFGEMAVDAADEGEDEEDGESGDDDGDAPEEDPKTVTGRVSLFWSNKAVKDTTSLWSEDKTRYDRLYWNVNTSTIPVDSLWKGIPDVSINTKAGEE